MNVQTIEVAGQRKAILPESQYFKLLEPTGCTRPEASLPPMPAKLPGDIYPAREYLRASIAPEIISTRRRLRLSQAGLAIPQLNRLERAKGKPPCWLGAPAPSTRRFTKAAYRLYSKPVNLSF
ncbi:MAG: hypothetical protein ACYCUV_08285 [Phycisphaerae bacterium]